MAHPDHDQAIGRLVGARLRGAAERRGVSAAAEAHPDAETWAAYVDGGLQLDEVARLETHLAGCPVCRHLLAVLAPEVSADAAPAAREVDTPAAGRGAVIPFPRRHAVVLMAAAAGLLMAVTLWSVSRLGSVPASSVAMSTAPARATEPVAAPPAAPSAAGRASEANAPSRLEDDRALDRVAGQAPAIASRGVPGQEQDKRKPDARSDAPAPRQPAELAAAEEKQTAQAVAAPVGDGRNIQLQSNTAAAGARARGPLATQQANQQAGSQQQYAQVQAPPASASAPANSPPSPATTAAAAAPAAPPARVDVSAATRERRANEQLAETVAVTSSGGSARRASARPEPERSQAAAGEREGQALAKDEAKRAAAFGYDASALPSFAEPGGRLRWRIADGRRLESSSDGGNRWTGQHTARDRLRAGTAPAIDSAWAVGHDGLVLRFVVPGGWAEVARPAAATLVAVSATSALSARVTADDGRVFETADGGATWTPAPPGTGPR